MLLMAHLDEVGFLVRYIDEDGFIYFNNVGVPTRYGHSQSGVIDRADYDNTVKLVVAMIEKLSASEVEAIRSF